MLARFVCSKVLSVRPRGFYWHLFSNCRHDCTAKLFRTASGNSARWRRLSQCIRFLALQSLFFVEANPSPIRHCCNSKCFDVSSTGRLHSLAYRSFANSSHVKPSRKLVAGSYGCACLWWRPSSERNSVRVVQCDAQHSTRRRTGDWRLVDWERESDSKSSRERLRHVYYSQRTIQSCFHRRQHWQSHAIIARC